MPNDQIEAEGKQATASGGKYRINKTRRDSHSKAKKEPFSFALFRESPAINLCFCILIPAIVTVLLEWVARGTLGANQQGNGFFQAIILHFPSFLLSYLLLMCIYVFISHISGWHWFATMVVGLLGLIPAIVTHFKLSMRGEPFLPWDLNQIEALMGVGDSVSFRLPVSVIVSVFLLAVLTVTAGLVRIPPGSDGKSDWVSRLISAGAALACGLFLMFGIFLNPGGSRAMGIQEDAWMQDRYYRNNGVITGFLTNLQMLNVSEPDGYGDDAARQILTDAETTGDGREPLYESSFAAAGGEVTEAPDIIFLMAEGFWDMTRLAGIQYDQPLMENIERLGEKAALGQAFTPSFGGGTCDVEFEVLTGYSMEFLPSGSKPFQQYLTGEVFALPWVLKENGYQTMGIHAYGGRFWNRDMAYPNLGIDTFIASEDFVKPDLRRGFISDDALVSRMIEELETRENDGPMFLHAVSMQNHTTYNRNRYPVGDLVKVTAAPDGLSDSVVGQLEDCATGIREMDAALGRLTDYLRNVERPTIVVFWGDHMNPMSDGYKLFEETGLIEKGDTASPELRKTPLLIWSNFADNQVDLGTISTYNVSSVMLDLFGLELPPYYEYLAQQMAVMHGRTRGVTINTDGSSAQVLSEEQSIWFNKHNILQYGLLFRDLQNVVPEELLLGDSSWSE